jgi:hypothetical protein
MADHSDIINKLTYSIRVVSVINGRTVLNWRQPDERREPNWNVELRVNEYVLEFSRLVDGAGDWYITDVDEYDSDPNVQVSDEECVRYYAQQAGLPPEQFWSILRPVLDRAVAGREPVEAG